MSPETLNHGPPHAVLQMLVTDSHLSECMDWAVKPTDARINRSIGNMVFYRGTDYREGQDGAGVFRTEQMYPQWARELGESPQRNVSCAHVIQARQ